MRTTDTDEGSTIRTTDEPHLRLRAHRMRFARHRHLLIISDILHRASSLTRVRKLFSPVRELAMESELDKF
jgi:hypothetical protein